MIRLLGICLALAVPGNAWSFEPAFPKQARELTSPSKSAGSYKMPTAVFSDGTVPSKLIKGVVARESWRISGGDLDTRTQALELEKQLEAQGYDLVFSCSAKACGGFDFRFNTEVLLPPSMFVDLSDFIFISALRETNAGLEAAGVLVSRTVQAGMVQVISVVPHVGVGASGNDAQTSPRSPVQQAKVKGPLPSVEPDSQSAHLAGTIGAELIAAGHSVLRDLNFEVGSSTLSEVPFGSLEDLARFLNADSVRRVALVGHTDSEGTLDANVSLSQKRAAAVKRRLLNAHNVSAVQVDAQGAGYLAPIASNQTVEGRTQNRRVEAVLLSGK